MAGGLGLNGAGCRDLDGIVAEVRQTQVPEQEAAVGVRIGAHAARTLRRKISELGHQPAGFVEQLLRLVALHPFLQNFHMLGLFVHFTHRHLVAAPVVLAPFAVDFLRASPPLGRTEDDHRPTRTLLHTFRPRLGLDTADFIHAGVDSISHELVHLGRITALNKMGRVAIAAEELIQFFVADTSQHARIGDLVPVQVQDRQHCSVGRRIEELVGMPGGRQWSGFRLAVADDAGDDQVGIVIRSPVRVRDRIPQFAAFVY